MKESKYCKSNFIKLKKIKILIKQKKLKNSRTGNFLSIYIINHRKSLNINNSIFILIKNKVY